jgi:hypothetical protein
MADKPDEIGKLKEALNMADCFSQNAFDAILTACSMTLAAMELPRFWDHPEKVADVLVLIQERANDAMNLINHEAEQHGCHYEDEAQRRRWAARSEFRTREAREAAHV